MHDVLIPLGMMMVFYFFMIFITVKLKEIKGKSICPICTTVSLTWAILLFLHFFEIWKVDLYFLSILMGTSICGIMYLVDKKIDGAVKRIFWKIGSVLLGVFLAWGIISHQDWKTVSIAAVFYFLLMFFVLQKEQKNKDEDRPETLKGQSGAGKEENKENWLKKLENCC